MDNFIKIFFLFLSTSSFAQLIVTPTSAASVLAQKIAGTGISVTNATLNCGVNASGTFTYTGSNLGISKGIILNTGTATDAANAGTYFCAVANGNNFSDPNLISIEPLASYDACVLQFDIIPTFNNINLTFVFGSEEYPNFVNSSYNDAFGFFLTGPNPSGGNYSGLNIGLLPNSTPVSINNVNAGTNPTYFHDNYTSPNTDIAYDGYTIPITSSTPVVPNATYHMKIAIADAGDEIYDSGLFIKDSVFTSCTNVPVVTFDSLGFADTLCINSGPYTLTGGHPSGGFYAGSGVSGNSFNVTNTGTFYIAYYYTDNNTGCSNSAIDSVVVIACTSAINQAGEKNELSIYPNPAKDVLIINTSSLLNSTIEIYNIASEKIISQKSSNTISSVNIENLSPGIYFVRLIDQNGTVSQTKFIKE